MGELWWETEEKRINSNSELKAAKVTAIEGLGQRRQNILRHKERYLRQAPECKETYVTSTYVTTYALGAYRKWFKTK